MAALLELKNVSKAFGGLQVIDNLAWQRTNLIWSPDTSAR